MPDPIPPDILGAETPLKGVNDEKVAFAPKLHGLCAGFRPTSRGRPRNRPHHPGRPLAQDSPSATVVTHISETLFELTPEGRIVPHLAESYAFSDGGRTLTLRLRRGIAFHDGTPFNAEAVKFNLERFVSRELASPFAFLLSELERVEVVDPYTVRLRLKNPFAPILAHLTHSSTAIQSPTAIQRLGAQYRDNPVGTGPYRFQAWQKGQFVDLVRNENYWGEKPSIPQVRFIPVPEGTTRVALVETGQAHVAVRILLKTSPGSRPIRRWRWCAPPASGRFTSTSTPNARPLTTSG